MLADSSQCIDFCNNLNKGGLYIIGATLHGQFGDFAATAALKRDWVEFIDANALKAFPQISVAPDLRNALESLVLLSGLGALQSNTVLLPLIRMQQMHLQVQVEAEAEAESSPKIEIETETQSNMSALVPQTPAALPPGEYFALCRNILRFDRNVVVTANFHALDDQLLVSDKMHTHFADRHAAEDEDKPAMEMSSMSSVAGDETSDSDAFLSATVQHAVVKQATIPLTHEVAQCIDMRKDNTKDSVFPMLLLQLAHILVQNKVWSRRAKARLRVLLFVDNAVCVICVIVYCASCYLLSYALCDIYRNFSSRQQSSVSLHSLPRSTNR